MLLVVFSDCAPVYVVRKIKKSNTYEYLSPNHAKNDDSHNTIRVLLPLSLLHVIVSIQRLNR